MTILECFETGAFNELINFPFEEVRATFNLFYLYVLEEQQNRLVAEATQIKSLYIEELNKIEEYMQGEYIQRINSGEDIPEFDEPKYKINGIEVQTKRKLINLITKYFNKKLFEQNKQYIFEQEIFKEESVEMLHELLISLNVHKSRIYSLLSIIGYYQRQKGYFLSRSDFLKICLDYSNQVYFINKSLGMKYRFVNIFIGSSRIKPPKRKKTENNVDTNIEICIDEQYKSNKFIDVDKISLLMLIQPYLKNNTKEINEIIKIMMKNFKNYSNKLSWETILAEVDTYISECEKKGIMKRL